MTFCIYGVRRDHNLLSVGCAYFGTEHLYTENVQRLSADILRAHVDYAFKTKPGAYSRCCHTVLTCTSLGDDAFLA